MAREWQSRVCCFVEEGLCCLCLGAQVVVSKTSAGKKGKKGKKGAKGAEEGNAAGEAGALVQTAAVELLKQLKAGLIDHSTSAQELAGNFSEATSSFPALATSEFDGTRSEVLAAIASSQALSVDRLVKLIDAKIGACS